MLSKQITVFVLEPIRKGDSGNNWWMYIIAVGSGVVIIGGLAVLFVCKVRPECMCECLFVW